MKTIILLLLMSIGLSSFSQDSTKREQYCQLVAEGLLFSNKVAIDVQYGEERSAFRDYRLRDESGKIIKFNSVVDGLNFLGKQGWKLVNAFPISRSGGTIEYHYIFKREFDQSELK